MVRITLQASGELLVSHLAAYGLLAALDAVRIDAFLSHDPDSLSFEPVIEFDAPSINEAARAVRRSAIEAEEAVEADIRPGKTANDRRAVIWARASFANDPSLAAQVLALRQRHVASAERDHAHCTQGLLAGIGAPAAWGPEGLKPSHGATALDGVLGNHTSDLVRGVLRPARAVAAGATDQAFELLWQRRPVDGQRDKTGWAPPGTAVDLAYQWLAALGLGLLPVAHRPQGRSVTPACWTRGAPRRYGITLPIVGRAISIQRLRGMLALRGLAAIADHRSSGPGDLAASAELRSFGLAELVSFERLGKPGSGTSVAFTFRRGRRISLR